MMVAESLFGTVQYGDSNVRYETKPAAAGYYYPAPGGSDTNDSLAPAPVVERQTSASVGDARHPRDAASNGRKDDSYWDRRRRNNEAAKRSREKRRYNDMILERRVAELTRDNYLLRAQLNTIRDKFGIIGEQHIDVEQVLAQLPAVERMVGFSKRSKPSLSTTGLLQQLSVPAARPVTPPSAPASGHEPSPFVYRQQSLRDEATIGWRSAGSPPNRERLTPEFSAVNLTKPSPERELEQPLPARQLSIGGESCSLPLKLRHKTHLGSPGAVAVKEEPHDWASSGDERDSGLSDRSGYSDSAGSPAVKRRRSHEPAELAPPHIRSELERLSEEVATLRCLLAQPNAGGVVRADA